MSESSEYEVAGSEEEVVIEEVTTKVKEKT